jgi:hypothetical protein
MRGSVRAPRFFSVPFKAITATPGTYRPSCKPIAVRALKGAADPIHFQRAIPMGCLEGSEAVAEY